MGDTRFVRADERTMHVTSWWMSCGCRSEGQRCDAHEGLDDAGVWDAVTDLWRMDPTFPWREES